jgi:hypothetical protein
MSKVINTKMELHRQHINAITKSLTYSPRSRLIAMLIIEHIDETGELETHLNHGVHEEATAAKEDLVEAEGQPGLQPPRRI